jgi:outer membrane protein assembly factor BamB
MAVRFVALGVLLLAAAGPRPATPQQPDPSSIAGIWRGIATTGDQSSAVAFEIRTLPDGVALYLTLPSLHAWRMPVDYLRSGAEGRWSVPDWKIVLARDGERLTGELGDPRVRFTATKADALPTEPAVVSHAAGPAPDWTYEAGAPIWASPASRDGLVYAADTRGRVHAVRAADGTRVWMVDGGAPVHGAPLVTADAVFVFDDAAVLRRLARRDGTEVWRASLGGDAVPRVLPAETAFDFDFHAPAPVHDRGVIYVTSPAGVVHALEADGGAVRWRRELGARVRASVAVSGDRVFVGTLANDVVALGRRDGEELWRARMTGAVTSAATPAGDVLIVGSRGAWLSGLDLATGRERWSRFQWFSWIESTGVLVDGLYVVGSSDLRVVRAIEPATGRVVWETDVLGWAWGTPLVTRDTVYAGVAGPKKYVTKHEAGLVALDRSTGHVRWRRSVPADPTAFVSGYVGSPVLESDVLVAPAVRGALEGYRVRR